MTKPFIAMSGGHAVADGFRSGADVADGFADEMDHSARGEGADAGASRRLAIQGCGDGG
ncbi:hypothetical protein J2847_006018 [Azospirillum agricola]|uniref:hypothetical protein n=1 Tax=Azospirillum agricola TaxID=1720247 RepID=UPI001AE9E6A0|nr:hypothetical protein [Azospirillum agricola]MBP2232687.1 hypothetical protein [Azospirillum agricola]